MSAWKPFATRGNFAAEIFTAKRLEQDGRKAEHPYLVVIKPDDSRAVYSIWHASLESVVSFCTEMAPHSLRAHTAGHAHGEDADSLISLCRRGTALH